MRSEETVVVWLRYCSTSKRCILYSRGNWSAFPDKPDLLLVRVEVYTINLA